MVRDMVAMRTFSSTWIGSLTCNWLTTVPVGETSRAWSITLLASSGVCTVPRTIMPPVSLSAVTSAPGAPRPACACNRLAAKEEGETTTVYWAIGVPAALVATIVVWPRSLPNTNIVVGLAGRTSITFGSAANRSAIGRGSVISLPEPLAT